MTCHYQLHVTAIFSPDLQMAQSLNTPPRTIKQINHGKDNWDRFRNYQ